MKQLLTLLIAFLISISSFAQQGINYKAILKDTNGNVLSNTIMTVQFTIHRNAAAGTIVYQEDHNYTTDSNGLVILSIGSDTTPIVGVFASINWEFHQHFLQTTITYSGGAINFDATEFMAVPYAKHAETAANVSGLIRITQNDGEQDNTGWRLRGFRINAYGPIGRNAVDLNRANTNNTVMSGNYGATGENSLAVGYFSTAYGDGSTAMGDYTRAFGDYSTAMGRFTRAESYNSTAIGRWNIGGFTDFQGNNDGDTRWVGEDPLFEVGNGTDHNNRSNALTILKNGKITAPSFSLSEIENAGNKALITKEYADTNYLNVIGSITAGGSLTIQDELNSASSWRLETRPNGGLSMYRNGDYRGFFSESTGNYSSISDRRTKKDITALQNGTLEKVMQLNPVSYLMKDQTDTKRNLGLISQEVQEIFPSITNYVKESDLLTLSYTELIPILIKALQEQQEIIETQNSKIENQNSENTLQNKAIQSLIERMNALEIANN